MVPSISEVKEDEKANTESEPTVPPESQQEETKAKDGATIITESTKKKKKKKKDASTKEQKTEDSSNSSLTNVESDKKEEEEKKENGTTATSSNEKQKDEEKEQKGDELEAKKGQNDPSSGPVVSNSKKTRPPYKYNPEKITLRFLFANKDGLTITVECKPEDTVGEVKGQLLSVWPKDLDSCSGGDQLRLICMGKGVLMPDTRTLKDCEVPVFKTHPTPINVAVRPQATPVEAPRSGKESSRGGNSLTNGGPSSRTTEETGQGCGCVIS